MKVYRIKHKPSGLYVNSTCAMGLWCLSRTGKIYQKKCQNFKLYENHPDYEVLYDEIKD